MAHLGIWRTFIWEFGAFLFGNLADFYLGIWRIFIWELGAFHDVWGTDQRLLHPILNINNWQNGLF
ncbi:MAG: hypothetical protein PUF28_03675, partial [bacterium]|nr:hypothetical protein [bacterium]